MLTETVTKTTVINKALELQLENPEMAVIYVSNRCIQNKRLFDIYLNTTDVMIAEIIQVNQNLYIRGDDYVSIYEEHTNEVISFDMTDEELESYVDNLNWQEAILIAIT